MKTIKTVKTTVAMDSNGVLTVPKEARQALAVDGAMLIELEVVDRQLILRPLEEIPDEDLWAYTPEHLEQIKQARARPRESDLRLTPAELERLVLGEDT